MKTKTTLLTALLAIAGGASLTAQVYSVNMVGYINKSISQGFNMVANQLNNSPDNKVTTLFPTPPNGTFVYKFDNQGGGYLVNSYAGGWEGDDLDMTLNPGEGVWVYAPSAFTNTFVGEIKLSSTNSLPTGFSIVSSVIPQASDLDTLNFPARNGMFTYQWNGSGYTVNNYAGGWEGDSGGTPTVQVGESFWVFVPSGQATNWVRNFSVAP